MIRYNTVSELISAKATNNIHFEGVENDYESEVKFVRSHQLVGKSRPDMIRKYGVDCKAHVIENFGYARI